MLLSWYAGSDERDEVANACPQGTEVWAPLERRTLSRFEVALEELSDAAAEAHVIMGWVLPRGLLERASQLRALVWLHAGCDELDLDGLKRRGIRVANVAGANAIAVAEHAFALMLASSKRLIVKHRAVLEARWTPGWDANYQSILLEGKTLAIVGLGRIGQAVARRAKAFDMRVVAVRRHPAKGGENVDELLGPTELHHALSQADFVLLALPISHDTAGVMDALALGSMKTGAYLINIARGNLIDEAALHDALATHHLAGYAADVWWNYTNAFPATYHFPIPSRTGIQHLPTVVATGNQASHTAETRLRCLRMGAESVGAFLRGKTMPREIDLDLGY